MQRQVQPEEEEEEEPIQTKPLASEITPLIQRQTEEEEEEPMQAQSMEEQPVQRQEKEPEKEEEEEETVQPKLMDSQIQRQEAGMEEEEEEPPVQMKREGRNTRIVSPQLEAEIHSMKGGGSSLDPATRAFFEPRFGYDFSDVRVHTGASAAKVTQGINAQAFTRGQDIFFGAGRYQPNTDGGRRLLAHELTHTIQQVPLVARKVIQRRIPAATPTTPTSRMPTESLSGGNGPAIQKQETSEDEGEGDRVQAKSITGNADADWGADGEIESDLHQSKGGGIALPPSTQASMGQRFGADFSQVRIHTDADAAALSQQLGAQAFTYGSDIYFNAGQYNPNSSAGQRLLAHELTHTIQQGAITATTLSPALPTTTSAIQRSPGISSWLEKAAKYIPGYTLIKFILGRSPITGKRVEPTGLNFLEAVLGLIPGFGPIWFEQLQKAKVAEKAGAWLDQEIKKVDITWDGIKALLAEFRRRAYYRFWKNIPLIKEIFASTWVKIKRFLGNVGSKVKQLIVAGVMRMAGPVGKKLLAAIQKGGKVLKAIFRNPIVFLANLFEAARKGFQQFSKNIVKHLKAGLTGWLFGAVKGLKIQAPATFDLKGIVTFIMEATGLTYDQRVRPPLKKRLGEKRLSYLERAVHFFIILKEKGLSGIWKQIKGFVGSLKKMLFEGVRNLLITKVVTAAIGKLVTMLNLAGLVAQGIAAIYNIVMFVIERFQQIADVVGAIFKSVAHIAAGKVEEAANYVEKTLGRTLPVVISLLARLTIGGVAKHIMKIIDSLKARVKKITIRLVNFIVTKARKFFKKKVVKSEADVSPREKRLHQKYIQNIKDKLLKPMVKKPKNFQEFYSFKKKEALSLANFYQKKVRKGIKVSIKFIPLEKDRKDNDIDLYIKIAPNTNDSREQIPFRGAAPEFKVTKFEAGSNSNLKIEYHTDLIQSGVNYGPGITIKGDQPYSSKATVEVEGNTKGVENEVWTIGYTQTLTKHKRVALYTGKSKYKKFTHILDSSLPMRDGKGKGGNLPWPNDEVKTVERFKQSKKTYDKEFGDKIETFAPQFTKSIPSRRSQLTSYEGENFFTLRLIAIKTQGEKIADTKWLKWVRWKVDWSIKKIEHIDGKIKEGEKTKGIRKLKQGGGKGEGEMKFDGQFPHEVTRFEWQR